MYADNRNIEREAMRRIVEAVAAKQGMSATGWAKAHGFTTGDISPKNTKSMTLDTMFRLCRALDVKPSRFVDALEKVRGENGL